MEGLLIIATTLSAGALSLVGGWAGSYFGSYLKKKGENLATHEDIAQLVEQMKAVTQATKEIEAKISSDVWNRQKQWEMKREVLFNVVKIMSEAEAAVATLASLLRVNPEGNEILEVQLKAAKLKSITEWNGIYARFAETKLLVAVVCGKAMSEAFDKLHLSAYRTANDLVKTDAKFDSTFADDLLKNSRQARLAIREELGVDTPVMIQSSKSSGV